MKYIAFAVASIFLFAFLSFAAVEEGETLFKSMGCMSCHNPEKASRINPSLMEISQAYQGKTQQLSDYFDGRREAIVRPEKAGMMKRYVEKTKTLTDGQRSALAAFVLLHK